MPKESKPTALATVFFIAFAAWATSASYQGPGFYGWVLGQTAQSALMLVTFGTFLAVAFVALLRALRHNVFPWGDGLVAGGALVCAELLWRFWISRGPADLKLIGAILDVATPLIVVLGILAFVAEFRRLPLASQRKLPAS